MTYETQIQDILYNDANIQAVIKSWVYNTITQYAVFNSYALPENIATDTGDLNLTVGDTTINHYSGDNLNGGQDVILTSQIIACRARTEKTAKNLQQLIHTALNRVNVSNGYFKSIKLTGITPANDTDNFNFPLEIRVITY